MMYKASVFAAVAGLALVNAQINLPKCAEPCVAKADLGCNPKELSCVCPKAEEIAGNADLIQCALTSGCKEDDLLEFAKSMASSCAEFAAGGASSTDAPSSKADSSVPAPTGGASSGNGSSTTPFGNSTKPDGTNGSKPDGTSDNTSPSTTPNSAAQSGMSVVALGVAMVAALAI